MILRSGSIVAFCTLLSRITGMVRELFVADMLGSSAAADSVNIAFKLPNLFRRIFAEGALSSVFIPIFNEKLAISKNEAIFFASKIFWSLAIILIILTCSMQYFMQHLMIFIAPGFYLDSEKFALTVNLCTITIPYLIFISISSLIGGMLNSIKKFIAFAFVPNILNIVVVVGGLVLLRYLPVGYAISYSIVFAGMMQLIFMLLFAKYHDLFIKIVFVNIFRDSDTRRIFILMGPAIITYGAVQLNIFISQSIASFIPGAVSLLSYADRLYQFPLSIIGVSFATVLLPEFSKLYKFGDKEKIFATQNGAIKLAFFLSVPCALGIIFLSHPIIYLIYQRGAFTASDTIATAQILSVFSLGLPSFIAIKIITSIFYANQDIKTPMRVTLYVMIVNILLNVILMKFIGVLGIALGTAIAAWWNLWLLSKFAKRNGYFELAHEFKKFLYQLCCCSLSLIICLIVSSHFFMHYCYDMDLVIRIMGLCGIITLGVTVYFVTAICIKIPKSLL